MQIRLDVTLGMNLQHSAHSHTPFPISQTTDNNLKMLFSCPTYHIKRGIWKKCFFVFGCKWAKTEEIKHDFTPIVNRKKTDLPLWNFILNELITQHNVAKCIWINFHYNFIVIIIHEGILNTPKSVKLDDTFVWHTWN